MINFLLVVLGVLLNCAGQVCLKELTVVLKHRGHEHLDLAVIRADPIGILLHPWFIGGCLLYAASVINWLIVLSRWEASVAYALMSMAYVVMLAYGAWRLGEPVGAMKVAGVVLIIAGVVLITREATVHA